jgi:hypothetical protein
MYERKNLIIRLSIIVLSIALSTGITSAENIIYVDDDATGSNDGSSWENAYTYLQDALADANSAEKPVEIRVAQGTYKPNQGLFPIIPAGVGGRTKEPYPAKYPADLGREATFQLVNGVALRGGYAGMRESDPDLRDIELYETILSGDLNSDDILLPLESFFACFTGPVIHLENGCETFDFNGDNYIDDSDMTVLLNAHNYGENSYHVVTGSGTDPNAVIDGFTITGGNAEPYLQSGPGPVPYEPAGGGMYNFYGSPEVLNCTFRGNFAGDGGGIFNIVSNPRLVNCSFYENVAREITSVSYDIIFVGNGHGGALFNDTGCSPEIIECKFVGNSAYRGGGVYNYGSFPMLNNCIFEGNRAENSGGGISNNYKSEPKLKDCIFINNNAHSGAGIENDQSNPTLTECIFSSNIAERSGGGMYNYYSNLTLVGCKLIGNHAPVYGGGMYNWQSNPTMKHCIFSGNLATRGGGMYAYLNSNPTLVNCTFAGNYGEKGGAFLCESHSGRINNIKLTNCILWDNDRVIRNNDGSTIVIAYSNIRGGQANLYDPCEAIIWGEGNIDVDPQFMNYGCWRGDNGPNIGVEPNYLNFAWVDGDYHLKSQAGRWDPVSESWIVDDVTSPCIDAGDPNNPVSGEPEPNGGRINMGAYGGTAEASKSYLTE